MVASTDADLRNRERTVARALASKTLGDLRFPPDRRARVDPPPTVSVPPAGTSVTVAPVSDEAFIGAAIDSDELQHD